MFIFISAYLSSEHVYQVLFENVERYFSYELRLTFCNEAKNADADAKGITIARCFSSKYR